MLSKAAVLPGERPAPNLVALKLKPGQGKRQTHGAASNSPTAPTSPLISAFTQGSPISSHAAAEQAAEPTLSQEGWPSSLVGTANVGSDADEAPNSSQAGTQHALEPEMSHDDQSGTTTTADVTMETSHGMGAPQGLEGSHGSKASLELEACSDSGQPAGEQHEMKKRFQRIARRLPVQVCA